MNKQNAKIDGLTYEQNRIYELLKNRGGWFTNSELSQYSGYDERMIRSIIQSLRMKRIPIASGNDGYIIDIRETKLTIKVMQAHIKTLTETVKALKQSIR